jgi:hypothetical protein
MLQRMDQIATRAQELSASLNQQMTKAREQTREQLQLLQQLCDSIGGQTRETRRTMEQLHLMFQDRVMAQDQEMRQDMDRLRLRTNEACDNLENMLGLIERLRTRLQTRGGSPDAR